MTQTTPDPFRIWNKCKECGKPAYTSTGVKCGLCARGIKPEQKFELYANGETDFLEFGIELFEDGRTEFNFGFDLYGEKPGTCIASFRRAR